MKAQRPFSENSTSRFGFLTGKEAGMRGGSSSFVCMEGSLMTARISPPESTRLQLIRRVVRTPAATLKGRQGFIDAYRELHQHVREVLELGIFLTNGNEMFADLYVEFHCFKEHPSVLGRPMEKGEVKIMTNWALYDLENDKINRIRIAHYRIHDPKLAKY